MESLVSDGRDLVCRVCGFVRFFAGSLDPISERSRTIHWTAPTNRAAAAAAGARKANAASGRNPDDDVLRFGAESTPEAGRVRFHKTIF
jgi:hypothetical protein